MHEISSVKLLQHHCSLACEEPGVHRQHARHSCCHARHFLLHALLSLMARMQHLSLPLFCF